MKIFTLYMAKKFFKPFFFGLGIFALLIFLGDLFDRMNYLVKSKASLLTILEYLWLEVPYWTIRIIPMATLLATLISLSDFIQSGEWIAAQSCGFKSSDFWKPLVLCSLLVTVLSFTAQETVLPICYRRSTQLWRNSIHPEWEWDKYFDVALLGRPNQFVAAQLFLPKDGRMERPILEEIGPTGVEKQLDAKLALWDGLKGRWVFYNGVERHLGQNQKHSEESFEIRDSDLDLPPKNLIPRNKNPDEMSLLEIRQYAKRLKSSGRSLSREFQVASHAKLAYPFTNVILCCLGIPVALRLRKAAKVLNFCAALGLSFSYLWFMELARTLGVNGQLPPALAAWLANGIFGALAVGLIRRYDV